MGQDNRSCMSLEKNGKPSSSKKAKRINIRCFFVTDRIQNEELKVVHCPTDEMVADFFTKPLQGRKLKKFRSVIMKIPDQEEISQKKKLNEHTRKSSNSSVGHRSVLEKKQKQ